MASKHGVTVTAKVTWSQRGGGCCPSASALSHEPTGEPIYFHATRTPVQHKRLQTRSRFEKSPAPVAGSLDHMLTLLRTIEIATVTSAPSLQK